MTQTRRGKYIQIHPAYESDIFTADIALIKLDEPLRFNRWIQPACLPSLTESYWENHPLPNTSCITVGWGQTIEGGPIRKFKFLHKYTVGRFHTTIYTNYFIATLQFQFSEIFLKTNKYYVPEVLKVHVNQNKK